MPKIDGKYAYLEGVRTPTSDYDMVNSSYLYNAKQRMRDAYASIRPKYKLGMIKMFKTKPTGLVGWRQMTDYGLHLASSDGSNRTNMNCLITKKIHKTDFMFSTSGDDYVNKHFYASSGTIGYGTFDYDTYSGMTGGRSFTTGDTKYTKSGGYDGGYDYNKPSGYLVYTYEYVGGNYYYDDVNDIHYGSPDPSYDMENKKGL